MSILLDMKWSVIAFGGTLVLGLISMGALGAALYYLCYPVFSHFYGNLNDWSGDWVWPATISAGMLWSVAFLAAGWINLQLEPLAPAAVRGVAYVAVLWLGAALTWAVILKSTYTPPL